MTSCVTGPGVLREQGTQLVPAGGLHPSPPPFAEGLTGGGGKRPVLRLTGLYLHPLTEVFAEAGTRG